LARATKSSESGAPRPALERVRAILRPEHRDRGGETAARAGYIDLLPANLASTGPVQDLMTSRLVPQIYERWWRPALSRIAKGVTGPGMEEEIRIARLMLGLTPGDAVLDVACGPGNFTREFARAVGPEGLAVGIDASRPMLERGVIDLVRSRLANMALVHGDASSLPFVDDSFDALCCFAALHLFADPFGALDEFARVLRPGGRVSIMASVRRQLTHPALRPLIERSSGIKLFEQDEVVEALRERGFTAVHQRLSGMVQFVGGTLEA
jgi:ubiquinone/menaquinone biosynthesis C-methylase UbiE